MWFSLPVLAEDLLHVQFCPVFSKQKSEEFLSMSQVCLYTVTFSEGCPRSLLSQGKQNLTVSLMLWKGWGMRCKLPYVRNIAGNNTLLMPTLPYWISSLPPVAYQHTACNSDGATSRWPPALFSNLSNQLCSNLLKVKTAEELLHDLCVCQFIHQCDFFTTHFMWGCIMITLDPS